MKRMKPNSILWLGVAATLLVSTSTALVVNDVRILSRTRISHEGSSIGLANGLSRKRRRNNRSKLWGKAAPLSSNQPPITSEAVRIRNLEQLHKLRTRDRQSLQIAPGELKIIYEDEHIVCVNKPSGVLCVPSEEGIPTLAQTVFETVPNQVTSLDQMVVHRLGMDTSGLVIFAKTMDSLRGMNTLFRSRKIQRHYEALVCGHVAQDEGCIDLPLMRDYEKPPFMRISTDEHQTVLLDLDAAVVGKKLLEAPKASQTNYQVLARETFLDTDLPVTRLLLTSVTGRTHQLNVHMAAMGHPIVGDKFYGWKGDAVPNGGLVLEATAEAASVASAELQEAIGKVATTMCVHAKSLSFYHPMRSQDEAEQEQQDPLYFECETPF